MNAFCTYCSKTKSHQPDEIPAIGRYQSARIQKVHAAATNLDLAFYILSGKYGLTRPDQCIPFYDHLLMPAEVPVLTELVAKQLGEHRIGTIPYFTKLVATSINLAPYRDTFVAACGIADVPCFVVELEDDVSTWRSIMQAADIAKIEMMGDRAAGERRFELLLKQNPRDGMIYFKRGEAYEAIRENSLAAADFQRAMAMFPKPEWKARARQALDRVTPVSCRIYTGNPFARAVDPLTDRHDPNASEIQTRQIRTEHPFERYPETACGDRRDWTSRMCSRMAW